MRYGLVHSPNTPPDFPEFLKSYSYSAHSKIRNRDFQSLPVFFGVELPFLHGSPPNVNSILFSVYDDFGKQKYTLEPLLPRKQNIQIESMFQLWSDYISNYAFFHNSE